jgi:two-component system, cell cycle sensor histidine kinase and response regulator CckA
MGSAGKDALNTAIEGVSKMLRRLIREDIDVCIRLASDLPSITADAGQTEQIIVNLAVNACDAMSAGGRLTIATWTMHMLAAWVSQQPDHMRY